MIHQRRASRPRYLSRACGGLAPVAEDQARGATAPPRNGRLFRGGALRFTSMLIALIAIPLARLSPEGEIRPT